MAKSQRTDDDFRVACGFFAHPKTKKLRRRLGDAGLIDLLKLWAWATQSRHDGNLAGLSDEDIEEAVDWAGEPGKFVQGLVDLRWLDGPEGARVLHEWYEHNPFAANKGKRVAKARAAAEARWKGQDELPLDAPEDDSPAPPPAPENATSINSDAPSIESDAPGNAPSTLEQCPPLHSTPLHKKSESLARAGEASPAESQGHSQAAALALALKRAGCPDASEFHPAIQQAVVEGLDPRALVDLAREKAGKHVAYLVATLRGRLIDAAGQGVATFTQNFVSSAAGEGPSPARESEDRETARRNARAHWRNLGYTDAEADDLMVGKAPTIQGAVP